MEFDNELFILKDRIANAQDIDELNYLRLVNEKKYWWTSILIVGLFYALNGKVGKMILCWILSFFTLGIFGLYTMYTSYRDQNEFNNQMEFFILQRTRELSGQGNAGGAAYGAGSASTTFSCPSCGHEVDDSIAFCPNCGSKVEPPAKSAVQFCSNCGTQITEGAQFCQNCGASVYRESSEPEPAEETEIKEPSEPAQIEESDVIQLPESMDVSHPEDVDNSQVSESADDSVPEEEEVPEGFVKGGVVIELEDDEK